MAMPRRPVQVIERTATSLVAQTIVGAGVREARWSAYLWHDSEGSVRHYELQIRDGDQEFVGRFAVNGKPPGFGHELFRRAEGQATVTLEPSSQEYLKAWTELYAIGYMFIALEHREMNGRELVDGLRGFPRSTAQWEKAGTG